MRITPGALWLKYRQRFGHGLRVAWYRDVVRPRILSTAPIVDTADKRCEIHSLTSKEDWLNLIWALKSFYRMSGRRYAVCIHEDGSLDDSALALLQQHFPAARVIRRKDADARLADVLRAFPCSLEFRRTNVFGPKIFDFMAYLESERMALFDSDLMFFAEPTDYLQRVENPGYQKNTFNADCRDVYTVESAEVRRCSGFELLPRINAGFGLIHRNSICWEWTEEFLALPGMLDGYPWRIEQTLYALCSSRFGAELLPDEYTMRLEPGIGGRCFRHYHGAIRHLMYSEGIPRLVKDDFLRCFCED
jgi:hypothetical protein